MAGAGTMALLVPCYAAGHYRLGVVGETAGFAPGAPACALNRVSRNFGRESLCEEAHMAHGFRHFRRMLLLTLMGLAAACMSARASEPSGTIAVVSDIHFNPFTTPRLRSPARGSELKEWPSIFASVSGQGFSARGEDTNQAPARLRTRCAFFKRREYRSCYRVRRPPGTPL